MANRFDNIDLGGSESARRVLESTQRRQHELLLDFSLWLSKNNIVTLSPEVLTNYLKEAWK
jgi:hypothetical protein